MALRNITTYLTCYKKLKTHKYTSLMLEYNYYYNNLEIKIKYFE